MVQKEKRGRNNAPVSNFMARDRLAREQMENAGFRFVGKRAGRKSELVFLLLLLALASQDDDSDQKKC
jgi:hypothetical protein